MMHVTCTPMCNDRNSNKSTAFARGRSRSTRCTWLRLRSRNGHKSYKETGRSGRRTAYFGFSGVRAEQISAGGAAVRLKSGSFDVALSDRRQRKRETQKDRRQRDRHAMDRHATERRPRVRRGTTGERGWDRADDSSHRSPESRNFCNKASRPSRHCARQPPTYNRVIRYS